jgi:acyl-CoA synthetase (AMP-forming)/AMP-acid ligase II
MLAETTTSDVARTVDAVVRSHAAEIPARTMVVDPDHQLTYARLDATTRRVAAGLIEAGVGKGTRVGLIMPNCVEWVQISVAVTRIGAVLVPLSTLLQPPELLTQLRVAAVQILVTVEQFRGHRYTDDLRSALQLSDITATIGHATLPALRRVLSTEQVMGAQPAGRAADVATALADTVTHADPLAIIFTSGSRGLPKGVIHSHGSALGAVRSSLRDRCIDTDSRLYLPMPFFWVGGFGGGILSALLAGATLVTEEAPRPETTLRLLRTERVTLFRGWPDQAAAVARHAETAGTPLPDLRPGSLESLLPAELRAPSGARANLFGMTESFGPYCGFRADTDMPRSAWGSCGRPFSGTEVRIVDPEHGTPVAEGEVGIIQLRGPHTLRGICRRDRQQLFTEDGYYPTGDLGHLDNGFLFYHGRSDDMVKVRGATVYPSEVETALRTVEGIHSAFVTDIAAPEGRRVAAAVIRDNTTVTTAHLRDRARTLLSSFKIPTVWLLLDTDDTIPRSATGKVDITRLRELLTEAGRTADGAPATAS